MDESASETAKALLEQEKESNAFIRHYEDVRFKITQVNVALAVILVGAANVEALDQGKSLSPPSSFFSDCTEF
jgi:hypothetical protein